jgi:hypothetical protein
MNSPFKFPRRVRIHGGECGAVARALHHEAQRDTLMSYEWAFLSQAESENVSGSTFIERKQMSTKTTLKRIALVAVSALGFGLMSVVPSNATADNVLACTLAPTIASTTACSTTAGTNNFVQVTVGRDGSVGAAVPTVVIATGGTLSSASTSVAGSGTSSVVVTGTTDVVLNVPTPTAGIILVRSYASTDGVVSSTATTTVVITVNAAGIAAGTLNVGASTSFITDSATVLADAVAADLVTRTQAAVLTADSTVAAPKAAAATVGTSTPVAMIKVTIKDTQATPAAIASMTLTASIAGAGLVAGTGSGTTAIQAPAASAATSTTDSNGVAVFAVYASGAGGTGTITISRTSASTGVTTVVATETVSFYGAIAKMTVLKGYNYIGSTGSATAGTTSADYVFRLTLEDADGFRVADAVSITATSQDLTKVGAVTCGSTASATGRIYCSATGNVLASGVAKVKFETGSALTPATAPYVSVESDIEVTQLKAAKFTITADTSVNAGGIITYTITATDANGRPVPDYTLVEDYLYTNPTVSGGALVDNGSTADVVNFVLGGPNPVNELFDGVYFVDGKATDSVQAPFAKATVKASFLNKGAGIATSGGTYFVDAATSNQSVALTTTVSDASSAAAEAATAAADAAGEAIDAANAATDAANLAAEAADAATVAAEEARDAADAATAAVEELATQVATLMAALKAQITTLANTVAKIAKKVRA